MENIFDLKLESLGIKTAHIQAILRRKTQRIVWKQKPIHYWSSDNLVRSKFWRANHIRQSFS